ncbi:TetR/AcrR family transcriptional regulator [Sphingoaurantiacus capsulatus]|uniref:TetR/AcrR family transcriptional regulator n=1 Tax=Sphingoaurantiacus capsulatus TaxID=1771310 RepID=A0ABV7XA24_9SPHN
MSAKRSRLGRDERRLRILDAAAELFHVQGYATTSVDAIGTLAGVSGPAVYRHFQSKQELLLELLDLAVAKALGDGEPPTDDDPARQLAVMVRSIVVHALAERALIGLLYAVHDRGDDTDRQKLGRIRATVVERWSEALRAARPELPPAEAATYVEAAMSVVAGIARRDASPAPDLYVRLILGLLHA